MAICHQYGIPHSFYLGGPLLWTEDDRDKAAAYAELLRQTCNGCGTRAEEWNPEQGGDRRAYIAEVRVCPGCEVRERGEADLNDPARKGLRGKQLIMRRPTPA